MVSVSKDLFSCARSDLKDVLCTPCVTEEQASTGGLEEKEQQKQKWKKVEIKTLMNLVSIDTKSYVRILILK